MVLLQETEGDGIANLRSDVGGIKDQPPRSTDGDNMVARDG
jgi:hypothetical protein